MRVGRPFIPIALSPNDDHLKKVKQFALVDSGSDWCLFGDTIASELGLEVTRGELRGFLGVEQVPLTAYFHDVDLIVGEMRVSIRAGFVKGLRFSYGILGQAGFFDRFVVTLSGAPPQPYVEVLTRQ